MTQIMLGDCLEQLKDLEDNSIDSVVCDPPYGLSFMSKQWDYEVPSVAIWKECLRVLKPGGHLLAFGGTRTYHRLVVNIEDAGFEIRDQIMWIYGSGFPKSLNVGKAIEKDDPTIDASKYEGVGTALKPANEPICLARKPLSEKTVAKNVLKHGVGGLNVDASRIELGASEDLEKLKARSGGQIGIKKDGYVGGADDSRKQSEGWDCSKGRFPANILFDEYAAGVLDEQSGISTSRAGNPNRGVKDASKAVTTFDAKKSVGQEHNDSGGASRFFYVAKASKRDRGEGNTHPTVKPIKLMEYLVKLVTPEGGRVLDPFMGSGTTGVAALGLGFKFVGIERDEQYFEICEQRIRDTLAARKLAKAALNNKAVV